MLHYLSPFNITTMDCQRQPTCKKKGLILAGSSEGHSPRSDGSVLWFYGEGCRNAWQRKATFYHKLGCRERLLLRLGSQNPLQGNALSAPKDFFPHDTYRCMHPCAQVEAKVDFRYLSQSLSNLLIILMFSS